MLRLAVLGSIAALVLLAPAGAVSFAGNSSAGGTRTLEIRAYNLKPGRHQQFRRLFHEQAFPMLARAGIDVIAFGPSLDDENSWFLVRSFASLTDRQLSEDAFYGSREWREGPRAAVLDCIESYTTVVVELDRTTVEGLRDASPDFTATGH